MALTPEVEAKVKALAQAYKDHFMKMQAGQSAPVDTNKAFMGFATERIARLEVICEGLITLYGQNKPN